MAEPDWEEGIDPLLWDGPHDDEYYQVSYILFARGGFFNRLLVALRPEVNWEPPFPRWSSNRRVLIWPDTLLNWGGTFFHHKDTIIVNDDYEVVKRF